MWSWIPRKLERDTWKWDRHFEEGYGTLRDEGYEMDGEEEKGDRAPEATPEPDSPSSSAQVPTSPRSSMQ